MSDVVDESQKFFEQVDQLRKSLEQAKKGEKLPTEFNQQINQLEKKQQVILEQLLPEFQKKEIIKKKTKIEFLPFIEPVNSIQAEKVSGVISLEGDLHIILLVDGSLQLVEIKKLSNKVTQLKELQPPIYLENKCLHVKKFKEKSFLAFLENGDMYQGIIVDEKEKRHISLIKKGQISDLKNSYELSEIVNNSFFSYKDFNEINRVLIDSNGNVLEMKSYVLPIDSLENWSVIHTISAESFLLGDENRQLVYLQIQNNSLFLCCKLSLAYGIKQVVLVEKNNQEELFFVIGETGGLTLVRNDVKEYSLEVIKTIEGCMGTLFSMIIHQKNGVILSDSGATYLITKIGDSWEINQYAEKDDTYFTQVYSLKDFILFLDDEQFKSAQVNQVEKGTDLLHISLYE